MVVHYIEPKIEKSFLIFIIGCNKLSPKTSVLPQLPRAPRRLRVPTQGLSRGGCQVSQGLLSCKRLMGPEEFTSKLTGVADGRGPQEAPLSGMFIKWGLQDQMRKDRDSRESGPWLGAVGLKSWLRCPAGCRTSSAVLWKRTTPWI